MRAECAAEAYPRAPGVASHWGRRLPATGCDGSNSATRQAIGAWKAGPMLGDLVQEAWSDRSRSSAGYVGHDAGCCEGSHAVACFPGNRTGARQPSTDRDTNRRTRVPEGAMGPRGPKEPARLSGGPQGLLGRWQRRPRVAEYGTRVPSLYSADSRGARASGRNGACVRGWPAQNSAPGAQLARRARWRALKSTARENAVQCGCRQWQPYADTQMRKNIAAGEHLEHVIHFCVNCLERTSTAAQDDNQGEKHAHQDGETVDELYADDPERADAVASGAGRMSRGAGSSAAAALRR